MADWRPRKIKKSTRTRAPSDHPVLTEEIRDWWLTNKSEVLKSAKKKWIRGLPYFDPTSIFEQFVQDTQTECKYYSFIYLLRQIAPPEDTQDVVLDHRVNGKIVYKNSRVFHHWK